MEDNSDNIKNDGTKDAVKSFNLNEDQELKKKRKSLEDAEIQPSALDQAHVDIEATTKAADMASKFEKQYAEENAALQVAEASRAVGEAEAEALFQNYIDSQVNTILPRILEDPTWRYCWVTTETSLGGDNVQTRLRGKWAFVKWGEIEGLTPDVMNNRSATMGEIITFNEMALMKIPRLVWEKIMNHNHHTQPLGQEAGIRSQIESMVRETSGGKKRADDPEYVSPGIQNFGVNNKRSNFKGI